MPHQAPAGQSVNTVPADKRAPGTAGPALDDYLDEQEVESFPASDPHSDWAGPPHPDNDTTGPAQAHRSGPTSTP